MLEKVRVSAVSVDNRPGDPQGNRQRIADWTARATDEGAQLVLFPELSLSGFIPNHPMGDHHAWLSKALSFARRLAEPVPGPGVDALTDIAAQHRVLLSAGILEDAGNLLFNTQVLVGPDGLIGRWRKMHIPMFETPFYNGGEGPIVIQTPLGRIGINICFDAFLPESTRLLAIQNVELVLFPFAADPPPCTPAGWAEWASPVVRARCVENGVFGIGCNYVGPVHSAGVDQTFPGGALAVGPRGELLAQWLEGDGQPGMMTVDFYAAELTSARAEPEYLFRFRRPELYRPLAE